MSILHFVSKSFLFACFLSSAFWDQATQIHRQDHNHTCAAHAENLTNVLDFAVSPSKDTIAIADTEGSIYLWDVRTGEKTFTLAENLTSHLNNLVWSPNNQFIGAGFDDVGYLWDARTGQRLQTFDEHPIQLTHPDFADQATGVSDIAITQDETLLATAQVYDRTVALWNIEEMRIIRFLSENEDVGITDLVFSPDGKILITQNRFLGQITVWNTQSGQPLFETFGEVMSLSPDGNFLATGGGRLTSNIALWDIANQKLLSTFSGTLSITDLKWTSAGNILMGIFTDGKLISDGFTYTGHALRAWDVGSGKEIASFRLVSEQTLPITLNPYEELIGVGEGNSEGSVLVWNFETEEIYRLSHTNGTTANNFEITSDVITTFQLSQNDRDLATGTRRGSVIVWDFGTSEKLCTYQAGTTGLSNIDWLMGDTKIIVFLPQDKDLFLLDVYEFVD